MDRLIIDRLRTAQSPRSRVPTKGMGARKYLSPPISPYPPPKGGGVGRGIILGASPVTTPIPHCGVGNS